MITATPPPTRGGLVQSAIPHRLAMRLAADEYRRTTETLAALSPDDWARPTPCSAWDVRQLACHMIGAATMMASPPEANRLLKASLANAARDGVDQLTAITTLHVSERADWTPDEVVAGARKVGPRAARGRRLTPWFLRRRDLGLPQAVNGQEENWSLGFVVDVITTRDPWMHRMDLALATNTEPLLTAEHDGVIIADVVAEWATRHAAPYDLELTGPAGGFWRRGSGGERIVIDAIDFCRALSGRGDAPGLLSVQVPF